MRLIHSPKCLEYEIPGHPESPQRLRLAAQYLRSKGYAFEEPSPCSEEDLQLVHTPEHIERIRSARFFEVDTPAPQNIFTYAKLAVGAAIQASQKNGFSLMRPPGHHAGKSFHGGFSYLNNIAVAVRKKDTPALILDIDGHHCNGTQDIFAGEERIRVISLHKAGFPGTGLTSGKNYANNLFKGEIGDRAYLNALQELLSTVSDVECIAVSAGFDAYSSDPLASLGLSSTCFWHIGSMIRQLELPCFCTLEGGYAEEDLGRNIHYFISGLQGVAPD